LNAQYDVVFNEETSNILQITSRKYPKLKEVDDVLGGAAAWENVDSTEGE
jgi:hypothetical protein